MAMQWRRSGSRNRAPRIQLTDGADQIVVEADQILSGIGLISDAGARSEALDTISAQGRFEDVRRGAYDLEQHLDVLLGVRSGRLRVADACELLRL